MPGTNPDPRPGPAPPPADSFAPRSAFDPGASGLPVLYQPQAVQVAQPVAFRKGRPAVPRADIRVVRHALSDDPDSRICLLREDATARAASFRVLRHRLAERGDARSIAVTSAYNGEGKTTCAVNLALALAESGRFKVLLVEANLKRPTLASLFDMVPSPCFLEQLAVHSERSDEPWTVAEIEPVNLHVLAVHPDAKQRRLLDGPTFAAAMDRLRGSYDYLVVDGASILTSADVALIEDAVDALVLVARAHDSRARIIRQGLDQVSMANVAGIVLMDT